METGDSSVTRVTVVAAGIIGAAGVMAAAAASHGGEARNLAAIATICLAHGPALLALGLAGRGRALRIVGLALAAGTIVFAADLGVREWLGHGAFPGAAPLGGVMMILGWLGIAVAAAAARRN